MLVSDIGEFGLINRIKKLIKTDSSVIQASGDDCAVIAFDKDRYLLFSCDMLVEGVDFKRGADAYLIGRKSLAVSLSDIAACGGIPRYALISLGLPKNCPIKLADRVFKGIIDLAKRFKVNIVGGDLSRTGRLTIDVSMAGIVEKRNLVLRKGAKIGDIIFVSGTLGGSILGKHFNFTPRVKEARFLVNNYKINAMIDISDGLAQDLGHILEESKTGAVIYEELIPVSKEARSLKDALYMGEDFELLFTVSGSEAKKIVSQKSVDLWPIGEVLSKHYGLTLADKHLKLRKIKPTGFCHF